MDVDQESRQWLLLLGAMLASGPVLKEAVKKIAVDDVPQAWRPLWEAAKSEQSEAVKGVLVSYGIEPANGERAVNVLLKTVQRRVLREYAASAVQRAARSKLLEPEQTADFLEGMATAIRAKLDALNGRDAK
jgi:hypothetical protein